MNETAGGSTSAPAGDAEIPASPAPHIVHLAERCPGSPHPFDVVTLRKDVTLPMGSAIAAVLRTAMGDAPLVEAGLALEFLRWGIEGWSFVEDGKHVFVAEPVARAALERWLPFGNGGLEVIEAASGLYAGVLAPFVSRLSTRLQAGPTETSTSATNGSGPTPGKRSKRSSRPATAGKRSAG